MFDKQDQWSWLDGLARQWGLSDALAKQQGVFAWRRAIGPQLARWARPLYVSHGVLHLAVASYAAASQFRMLEPQLVESLRQVAPDSGVRRLRLHVQPQAGSMPPKREAEVTAQDQARAELLVPDDTCPPLREQLVHAAARACAQEREILQAGGCRCSACGVAFLGQERVCPLCAVVGAPEGD